MAKIPRINQGDRPSSIVAPGVGMELAGDPAIAGAIKAFAGVADVAAGIEVKRLQAAMAAKQAIVDASEVGRLSLQFENDNYNLMSDLETEFANTPEKMPEEYIKRSRERANAILDPNKTDANDRVRLAAVKDAESAISSGLRTMYGRVSELQTKKVTNNLVEREFWQVNQSRNQSQAWLASEFQKIDENPMYDMAFGKKAAEERRSIKARMARAQMQSLSEKAPLSARKALESGSGFYGKYLPDTDFQSLREKTERDANNLADRNMLDTLVSYGEKGSKMIAAANAGVADAAFIQGERDRVQMERRKLIDNTELKPEAKKKASDLLDKEAKFVDAVEMWQARNTRAEYLGADLIPQELEQMRLRVMEGKNELGALLEYRNAVLQAGIDKKMSPGRTQTLLREVSQALPSSIATAQGNEGLVMPVLGWNIWSNSVQKGTQELNRMITKHNKDGRLSDEQQTKAITEYVEQYTKAMRENKKEGEMPSDADMIRFARRAFYFATDLPMPEKLR